MDVREAIRSRRSIRSFKKQRIETEKLLAILQAARLAPSARNEQQWLFVVVRHPETVKKLAFACNGQQQVGEADTVVCCCIPDADKVAETDRDYRLEDIAVANTQMMLQATEVELGSCWIGDFNDRKVKTLLHIPDTVKIHSLLAIGYPHYTPSVTERKPESEIFRSDDFTRPFDLQG